MEISDQEYKYLTDDLRKAEDENREYKRRIKQLENIVFAIESVCKTSRY